MWYRLTVLGSVFTLAALLASCASEPTRLSHGCEHCYKLVRGQVVWICGRTLQIPEEEGGCLIGGGTR